MNLWGLIRSDIEASAGRRPKAGDWARHFLTLRGVSTILFRIAHSAGRIHPLLGLFFKQINQFMTGAHISWQARIGPGLVLFHPNNVSIGANTIIGANARLQQDINIGGMGSLTRDYDSVPSPVLGDGVFVGPGARILGPVMIGDAARIGANAVVLVDVPAEHTAVGVPARVLPPRNDR